MYVLCTLGFFSQLETTLSTPLSAVSIHSKFLIRLRLWSYSGFKHILFLLSYSGLIRESKEDCSAWILGINPRMTFAGCFVWILVTSPRMTENRVFRSDSNFFKKWQKPRVEALKRSEIECLGFTERERDLC